MSSHRVPFGYAAGQPDKTLYQILEILEGRPERNEEFNRAMAAAVETMPITGMYDFSRIGKSEIEPERALLVDVGGGKGQARKFDFITVVANLVGGTGIPHSSSSQRLVRHRIP